LNRIEHWARQAAGQGAELVLFPESGIHAWWQSRENRRFAEGTNGPSVRRLILLAKELNLVLAVGLTELEGDKAFLTHLLIDGQGILGRHRKRQLAGGTQGEGKVWDPGEDNLVFTVRGRRLGFAICYESVHPETCAALKASGAEIILAPYANGTAPQEILDPERRQRRWIWERVRENRIWYVACDATPHQPDGSLRAGAAFVISPLGALVACTPPEPPGEAMVIYKIPDAD